MKIAKDAVDLLYDILVADTNVASTISGDLYKFNTRPIGSTKTDIVINLLTASDGIIQPGIANINIFAANKAIPGSIAVQYVPDVDSISAGVKSVIGALGEDK